MLGVFLLGFGQPSSLEAVAAFIKNVTGREPSKEAVESAIQRYLAIGGKSPFLEITQKQAQKLHSALKRDGVENKVYIGMRHGEPNVSEAVKEALQDKITSAVVITLAPQYSNLSVGKYLEIFRMAHTNCQAYFSYREVISYGTHSLFLQAVAEKTKKAFYQEPKWYPSDTPVIFSAHSLPITNQEDIQPYLKEIEIAKVGISKNLGLEKTVIAFQSKGGGNIKWLTPSLDEVIEEYAKAREKRIMIVPIGFVSDHLETLYDIDILAKGIIESKGMKFRRVDSLNDSPLFIELLKTLVMENLK